MAVVHKMERLKLKMPPGEDENLPIDTIPVMMSAADAVLSLAALVSEAALIELVGFPVAIGAAFFGSWFAIGSGYAEAREAIRAKRQATGFAQGLLMACDGRKPHYVAQHFWERIPEFGYDFVDGGKVAQNAYNQGLVTGYWNGYELTTRQQKMIWVDIRIRTNNTKNLNSDKWSTRQWTDWYREMGGAWQRYHMTP